ncbi:MAG: LysE/ArgO family amino acid transporter [Salinibacterium sp.]|nr:LysE/ArgO family amino acid transporter [Salinibacterium sp.]
MTALLAGLGLGVSLIVAIGAQNAFVLRQGLRREHVLIVVVVCAASDAVLIVAGIAGLGALIEQADWVLVVVRIAGAAFLAWYGIGAVRRVVKPKALEAEEGGERMPRRTALVTVLALTWLNPHVYLDTVVLLGSIGGTYGEARWWFALGAIVGSVVWFTALGFGSRALRPLFAKPVAWRVLDVIIAVVMFALAASLIVGLFVE